MSEESKRITKWEGMEGKTVRKVIDRPSGRRSNGLEAVIVFNDDSWLTLFAESNGSCAEDGASIDLYDSSRSVNLGDYLSPDELLEARVINIKQCEAMIAKEVEERKAEKAKRAARLRAEADALETGK